MSKRCQLRMAPGVLRTVICAPCTASWAWPAATFRPPGSAVAPTGLACAGTIPGHTLSRLAAISAWARGFRRGGAGGGRCIVDSRSRAGQNPRVNDACARTSPFSVRVPAA